MKWFWRVSQACPDTPLHIRFLASGLLVINEVSDKPSSVPGVEWWLAYRSWDGEPQRELYEEAKARAQDPIPPLRAALEYTLSITERWPHTDVHSWVEWLFRVHLGMVVVDYGEFDLDSTRAIGERDD